MCVHACVRACVHACVRACVHACLHACGVRVCVCDVCVVCAHMKVICVCMYINVHACLQVLYSFICMVLCTYAILRVFYVCVRTVRMFVCCCFLFTFMLYYFPFLCRFEFEKLVLALSTTRESAAKHISEHLSLLQTSDFSTPSAPDHQLHTFGSVILGCYVSEMGKVMGVWTYVFVDMNTEMYHVCIFCCLVTW